MRMYCGCIGKSFGFLKQCIEDALEVHLGYVGDTIFVTNVVLKDHKSIRFANICISYKWRVHNYTILQLICFSIKFKLQMTTTQV